MSIFELEHEEARFWAYYGYPTTELVYCEYCRDEHEELGKRNLQS